MKGEKSKMKNEIINARIEDTDREIKDFNKVSFWIDTIKEEYPSSSPIGQKLSKFKKEIAEEIEFSEFYLQQLETDRETFGYLD